MINPIIERGQDTVTVTGQSQKLQNVFDFALYYHNEGGLDDGVFDPDTEPLICAMMDILRNHQNNISYDFLNERFGEFLPALGQEEYARFISENSGKISEMLLRANGLLG